MKNKAISRKEYTYLLSNICAVYPLKQATNSCGFLTNNQAASNEGFHEKISGNIKDYL